MKIAYDSQADTLVVAFEEAAAEASRELVPGLIVNTDREGNPLGVEILNASKRMGRARLQQIMIDFAEL